tara:strand:+ start:2083 stop:2607 length:525 start_codon:yes stop_codon:yes gene_type:complete
MKGGFYILIVVCMTIFSCTPRPLNNQLKVFGHRLGDTINTDFVELEKYGENFGLVAFKQDDRFIARTMKNHLFEIWAINLRAKEFQKFKNIITRELGQEPEHFVGKTHNGIDFLGEEYYWVDTITHYEYSLEGRYKNDSIYSFTITNKAIRDSIGKVFIKDYGKETIIEIAEPN